MILTFSKLAAFKKPSNRFGQQRRAKQTSPTTKEKNTKEKSKTKPLQKK